MKLGLNTLGTMLHSVTTKNTAAHYRHYGNYAYHYIYMPPAVYEQVFESLSPTRNAFAIVPDLNDTVKVKIAGDLLERDDILWHCLITIPS